MIGTISEQSGSIWGSVALSLALGRSVSGTEGLSFAKKGGQLIHVAFLEASLIPFLVLWGLGA